MVAGPVYTFDALVPIDDLEDLTDECAGLLSSILVQGEDESSALSHYPGTSASPDAARARTETHPLDPLKQVSKTFPLKSIWLLSCSYDLS